MKKEVFIFLSLILILSFVFAEDISVSETDDDSKVDKAYDCLEKKIESECSSSLEDNIFTLLAIGKCGDEVTSSSKNNGDCWPASDCKIKQTAQAVLALKNSGLPTANAEKWLFSHNATPSNIEWYLEIESSNSTICEIRYSDTEYKIIIGEDKKISSGAGNCLSLSEGGWWLKVSSSCYNDEFEISCDNDFITTLLYKKSSSSTIYISEEANIGSANDETTEKIESLCFAENNKCDYEGSLWAALTLSTLGYDISSYIPYLTLEASGNDKYIPESFLYTLVGSPDFLNSLLLKQKNDYWDESGNKFYDTALALYPLQYEEPNEKSSSKEWLLKTNVQGTDGCWGGSIKDTAFILHSVWQRTIYSSPVIEEDDCEDSNYYCMSSSDCKNAGGTEKNYFCSLPNICCSQEKKLEKCLEQGGEICNSDEECTLGSSSDASDIDEDEECCIGGSCELNQRDIGVADCESNEGTCRTTQCEDDEEQSFTYNCDYSDTCCVKKSSESIFGYWWIWLLIILIIILIIAIIFRDRLRIYWNKFKSSRLKSSGPSGPFGARQNPMASQNPIRNFSQQRMMPRRILPPSQIRQPRPLPRKSSEVDEVLKKLKEIGK